MRHEVWVSLGLTFWSVTEHLLVWPQWHCGTCLWSLWGANPPGSCNTADYTQCQLAERGGKRNIRRQGRFKHSLVNVLHGNSTGGWRVMGGWGGRQEQLPIFELMERLNLWTVHTLQHNDVQRSKGLLAASLRILFHILISCLKWNNLYIYIWRNERDFLFSIFQVQLDLIIHLSRLKLSNQAALTTILPT